MTREEAITEIHAAQTALNGLGAELVLVSMTLRSETADEEAVDRLGVIMERLESARCWIRRAHASADRQFKEGASWTISGRRKHGD